MSMSWWQVSGVGVQRKWAGLERIPAVVQGGVNDQKSLELALIENIQRADLDPMGGGCQLPAND